MSRTVVLGGLASVMVLAGVIILGRTSAPPPPEEETQAIDAAAEPNLPEAPAGAGESALGPARAARIRLVDRNDPARIAWDLEADAFDPVPNSDRVVVTEPRGWVYLDPQSPTYFRADRGVFTLPQLGQEPDTGQLEGGVDIRIFAAEDLPEATAELPSPDTADPALRVRTETLDFDSLRGRLISDTPVRIDSPTVVAELADVNILLDPEKQQVESVNTEGGGWIEIAQGNAEQAASDPSPRRQATHSAASRTNRPTITRVAFTHQPETTEQTASEPLYYRSAFFKEVILTQGPARITSEYLEAFAEIIDGKLPEDAIQRLASARGPRPSGLVAAVLAAVITQTGEADQPTDASGDPSSKPPVRLEWQGDMEITRHDTPIGQMRPDSLAAVFHARDGVPVRFSEANARVSGVAQTVRYGVSTANLSADGNARFPLRVDAEDAGMLETDRLEVDLVTGVGSLPSAGTLTAVPEPTDDVETPIADRVRWSDRADFLLAVDGAARSLQSAAFQGDIRLTGSRLQGTGAELLTDFAPSGEGSGEGGSDGLAITRARLRGSAQTVADNGSLNADEIDIRFHEVAGEAAPESLTAAGNVTAIQQGSAIEGDLLEAFFEPGPTGEPVVTRALIEGNAQFRRDDGVFARGQTIRNDLVNDRTEVLGEPAQVGSPDGRVSGPTIILEQAQDSIAVAGQGEFERTAEGETTATASWTDSMRYTGETGRLEAFGNVVATASSDPTTTDTVEAARLEATVAAGDALDPQTGDQADPEASAFTDLHAFGNDERPAVLRSYRRDIPDADPTRLLVLSGRDIRADNEKAMLVVRGAGELLTADLRQGSDQDPSGDGDDAKPSEARGAALFDWQRDMVFDRRRGEIRMRQNVTMVRQGIDRQEAENTEILAERLTALLAESGRAASLTDAAGDTTIETILAEGAVWARRGPVQVVGDRLDYQAVSRNARVTAPRSGVVTVFNEDTGSDVSADEILWDLATNRVDLIGPRPVFIPR